MKRNDSSVKILITSKDGFNRNHSRTNVHFGEGRDGSMHLENSMDEKEIG